MAAAGIPDAYILAAIAEAQRFHFARGSALPRAAQPLLRDPSEQPNIFAPANQGGALIPRANAATIARFWDDTPEAQFRTLFNAAVVAYETQYAGGDGGPRITLYVPAAKKRAAASFRGFAALDVAFNRNLSFASKLDRLKSLDREAYARAEAIASLKTPGKRSAVIEKRNKGKAHKRSGKYGKDQYGSNKRSPHQRAYVHASPVPGANFAAQLRDKHAPGSPIPASVRR